MSAAPRSCSTPQAHPHRHRLAQRAQHRPRDGLRPGQKPGQAALELQMLYGMAEPMKAAAQRDGLPGARLRADRGAGAGHGLSGAPAAGEHLQRVLAARLVRRGRASTSCSPSPPAAGPRAARARRRRTRSPTTAFATSRCSTSRTPSIASASSARSTRSKASSAQSTTRGHRWQTAVDTDAIKSLDPGIAPIGSSARSAWPRCRAGRARRSRRPGGLDRVGGHRRRRSALITCSSASPTGCASAATSWPPGWSTRSARPGARPTRTSARPSTSASSTPAR